MERKDRNGVEIDKETEGESVKTAVQLKKVHARKAVEFLQRTLPSVYDYVNTVENKCHTLYITNYADHDHAVVNYRVIRRLHTLRQSVGSF